jgi:2-aminoethylphosphonate-pyruvate transaminase
LLAFHQALKEIELEGGVTGRAARYQANYEATLTGMLELGFETYLAPKNRGYIITSFLYPNDPRFDFRVFYELLNEKGFVIYPGKLSLVDCFRIGHVGRIDATDVRALLAAIAQTLAEMGVSLK